MWNSSTKVGKWCLMFLVLADSIEIMNEEGGGGAMHVVALFLIHT